MSVTKTPLVRPSVATAKSTLANKTKHAKRRPSPEALAEVVEARRELAAAKLERHIQAVVDESPPLSDEVRSRLALLLRGAS